MKIYEFAYWVIICVRVCVCVCVHVRVRVRMRMRMRVRVCYLLFAKAYVKKKDPQHNKLYGTVLKLTMEAPTRSIASPDGSTRW